MINKEFNPSFFHPYYFIRKGLLKKIKQHAGSLKGRMLDFGCGSKPYRSLFNVKEYIGVDYMNEGHPHENEQIDIFYDGKKSPCLITHLIHCFVAKCLSTYLIYRKLF